MHVAVEHFESSLGHTAIPLPMLSQIFITPSVGTSLDERYVPMLADPAIDTSVLTQKFADKNGLWSQGCHQRTWSRQKV